MSELRLNDPDVIRAALTTPATWAVVGLSNDRSRTAYAIAGFLRDRLGQRVIPIHPRAEQVVGEAGYRSLGDVPAGERVSVVDLFVNSSRAGAVVDEAIAERERLGIETVWLQLGVVDRAAAQRAADAGLNVVMDTCPKIEYPRLTASRG